MKGSPVENKLYVTDANIYKRFCRYHTYTFPTNPVASDDFKDLFLRMFLENPADRISLEGIAAHPWLTNEDLPTEAEIKAKIKQAGNEREGNINRWLSLSVQS